MDLTALDTKPMAEQGQELTIKHPVTDEPLDIVIKLLGKDSKKYQQAQHTIQNQGFKKKVESDKFSQQLEEGAIKRLAACTVSWVNVEINGEPVVCNEENAIMVYSEYRWIADQVSIFVEDRANFLPRA